MKLEDRVQDLEYKILELENKNQKMKEVIAFLLNKSHLKYDEALNFTELFPEWLPNGKYPKGTYLTHGVDENGNKHLYYSETDVLKAEPNKFPGLNSNAHALRLYMPINRKDNE